MVWIFTSARSTTFLTNEVNFACSGRRVRGEEDEGRPIAKSTVSMTESTRYSGKGVSYGGNEKRRKDIRMTGRVSLIVVSSRRAGE